MSAEGSEAVTDPAPWVHVGGARVADPGAPTSPQGGFTYAPRREYADYPDRYVSTRHPEPEYCETHGRHHGRCASLAD